MSITALWLAGLLPILAIAAMAWLLSLVKRDASVADVAWPILIASTLWAYAAFPSAGPRALLVQVMAAVWALRLAAHLILRGWGEPEDRRYRAMRERNDPGFGWKSLYLVFGLQGMLGWIVSLPLLAACLGAAPLGWLDLAGGLVFVSGLAVETAADWQLLRFQRRAVRDAGILQDGLWRYSRHPNYFGEFLVWWGFFLVAWSAGGWWSIASPLLMSVLLLRVSGVPLLESGMVERHPAYAEYCLRASAFFPGKPRGSSKNE